MDDQLPAAGRWPEDMASLLAVCTSCRRLHPDGYACACLVERAATVAQVLHDLRRARIPAWRRPRPWDDLPLRVRQDYTGAGLTLVDALEGSGWTLVADRPEGAHTLEPVTEPVERTVAVPARFVPDPDAVTPPSGQFRVPNVVR